MKKLDPLRLRLSLRAIVGCLLGMSISPFIPHIQTIWVLITIAILMTSEVRLGALLQKTSWRLAGTTIGAIPALAVAYLGGPNNAAAAHYGLLITVGVVTYWGVSLYETSPTATLAVVTASMLLADPSQTRDHALLRLASIALGAVIALLCAHIIFPIRSRWALQQATLDCIGLQRQYAGMLADRTEPPPELGASIFSKLTLIRRLTDEARLEGPGFDREHHLQVWARLRAMFRYLQMVALAAPHPELHPELGEMREVADRLKLLFDMGGPARPALGEVAPELEKLPEVEAQVLEFSLIAMSKTLSELLPPEGGAPVEATPTPSDDGPQPGC